MQKLLLILSIIFCSLYSSAQTTRCMGGDTLCVTLLPDTTICSATKLAFTTNATSSVNGANINYQWTDITNNSILSSKDSLNHTFSSPSTTSIDIEVHVQYDTFNVYDTLRVTINPLPVIGLKKPYLTEACFTESIYLNAFNTTPIGGSWHHWEDTSAINNTSFLPGKVGTANNNGAYNLTYITTNTYGCTDSSHTKIKILRLPPVQVGGAGPFCHISGLQNLEPFVKKPASPQFGLQHWSSLTQPNPISEKNGEFRFDPTKGLKGEDSPNILNYTFTDLTTGCYDSDTMHVIVHPYIPPTYTYPSAHCASGPILKLDSLYNIQPAGGKWNCLNCIGFNPVVDSLYINPSARPLGFTYNLQYHVQNGNCYTATAVQFTTRKVPELSVSADDYNTCENDDTINLHASPYGGSWSGKGVTDSTFYINQSNKGDTNTLTYTYYDATLNCNNYADVNIVVWEHPVVNLTTLKNPICDYDSNTIYASYNRSVKNISWTYSGNGNIQDSNDSIIYYPAISDTLNGVIIYATGSNPGCNDSTESISFSVLNCSKVSVPPIEQVLVKVYPNPASDRINLVKTSSTAFKVSILSIDGKVLNSYTWEAANNHLSINRNSLPAGIYYLLLTDDNGSQFQQKLVLK